MAVKTFRYADLGLEDPVAIVGFPSVGLVSSITANYYVGQLEMEAVAGMSSPSMPPYCLIHRSRAYPPVRFYGRKHTTKTGRDAIVCLSEYAPKPEDCYEIAQAILGYLKYAGVRQVICLDGIARTSPDDVPVACGSSPGSSKMMQKSKFTVMEGGMVKGVTGIMLYEGPEYGMDVTALMVPANPALPDPGASAAFIPAITSMVPGLRVSAKPLLKEADEINKRLTEQAEAEAEQTQSQIYG